ncbi:MAG: hypothetical protein ACK553_07865 [Planctomycetota bacterium]
MNSNRNQLFFEWLRRLAQQLHKVYHETIDRMNPTPASIAPLGEYDSWATPPSHP